MAKNIIKADFITPKDLYDYDQDKIKNGKLNGQTAEEIIIVGEAEVSDWNAHFNGEADELAKALVSATERCLELPLAKSVKVPAVKWLNDSKIYDSVGGN